MQSKKSVTESETTKVNVDVLVVGGGIAGLWTHARLRQAGYQSVLLESAALGAGQTRYAQGIIHGGTKYALTGKLTASSNAVADMPARWRACYQGEGELDLSQAKLLSKSHYLWSNQNLSSRIAGFFASKVMQSRSTVVAKKQLPKLFQHKNFLGKFYCLNEPVFDTLSVIKAIAKPQTNSILIINKKTLTQSNQCLSVQTNNNKKYQFNYKKIIYMAGEGNQQLIELAQQTKPKMQLRPLKMVVLRGDLKDKIFAHCLGASVNPRITITSHIDSKKNIIWYLGGQLAEQGVHKSDHELIASAKKELKTLIPWLNLKHKQWGVLKINRAEIKHTQGQRPNSFSVVNKQQMMTAWPTKMALAPVLADSVLDIIKQEKIKKTGEEKLPIFAPICYADFPWNDETIWLKNTESV